MRKLGIFLVVAGFAGCILGDDPTYCTGEQVSPDGRKCDPVKFTWSVAPPGDMATPPACANSKECMDPNLAVCGTNGRCVACNANLATGDGGVSDECVLGHPMLPYCVKGACVACTGNADCLNKNKTCDTRTHTCEACTKNADCASGICEAGGNCADHKTLIYVDAKACAMGKGMGTYDQPYCKVQDGIDHKSATLPKRVVVRDGTYSENLRIDAATDSVNLMLIGSSKAILQPAAGGEPALKIAGDGSGINKLIVTLDGFTITGATQREAVSCAGSAVQSQTTVKLAHSIIRDNTDLGVLAASCDIVIDQALVGPRNGGGGISLVSSDFTVANTIVFKNGAETANGNAGSNIGGIGVTTVVKRSVVMNSTIVANSARLLAEASGIIGPITGKIIIGNTVIFGNLGAKNGKQLTESSSTLEKNAFPGAMAPNIDIAKCMISELFSAPQTEDYHPKTGTAPCTLVDQGGSAPAGQSAPEYDLDGKPRPAGAGFDIGAYELQ